MKKVLSIALAVMMTVSLFAVNVSASVIAGEPEETIYLVNQDFQDADNMDLTLYGDAATCVVAEEEGSENTVLKLSPENRYANASGAKSIAKGTYTVEFDVKAINPAAGIDIVLNLDEDKEFSPYGDVLRITSSNFKNLSDWSADTNWYTYKAVISVGALRENPYTVNEDGSKTLNPLHYRNVSLKRALKGTDTWETINPNYGYNAVTQEQCQANENLRLGYRVLNNTTTAGNSTTNAAGVSLAIYGGSVAKGDVWADTDYSIDNFKVSYVKDAVTYPSMGILVNENYEGTTKYFGTPVEINGNKGLDLNMGTITKNTQAGTTVNFASLPQKFIFTADICMAAENTEPFLIEYFTDTFGNNVAGEARNMGLDPKDVVAGEWYTMKLAKVGGFSYRGILKNHKTGEVKTFTPVSRANISGSGTYNRLLFRVAYDSGANEVYHWYVDNVMVTEIGALAVADVEKAENAVSATINVDAATNTANPAKARVFVSTYNEDRLVDVDFKDMTFGVDGAADTFNAEGAFDAAYVYIWNGTTPISEKNDITSMVK